ncbi:MAG: ATP synthase subunit C [Chlamydiales bacterium]|nr:ATP synthase subunit C [Chlamydiia bacterium]MCP5506725.1 ATP synthase subunit C [Chlamydiales bacterium]
MDFGMIGPALAMAFGAIGSAIGCGIAGMASHAVMSRVEEGHGKYILLSAMPSSQVIYGFALMFMMQRAVQDGSVTELSALGIGLAAGVAIMMSAYFQGKVCATAIQATAKQPSVFGKCFAAVGIVESFALFAFVFAMMLL